MGTAGRRWGLLRAWVLSAARLHGSCAVGVGLALAVTSVAAADAAAQAPVIVVIESDSPRVNASALRGVISEALGAPAVRLSDEAATRARGTLSIAVARNGRSATVYFRSRTGVSEAVLVEVEAGPDADARGLWLAEPAAAAVRTVDAWLLNRPTEVLDPWIPEHRGTGGGVRVGDVYVGTEVLDPWERHAASPEPRGPWAARLTAPPPPR